MKFQSTLKVQLTLTEELLATTPSSQEIHSIYVASKAPDAKTMEEEIAEHGVEAVEQKGMTIFMKEKGVPFFYDYHFKGFFKDACGMLLRSPGSCSSKLRAYKKNIDGLVFVNPRKVLFSIPKEKTIGNCQRPLRTDSPQGTRMCLANSETVPEGTTLTFEIGLLQPSLESTVKEWLDYGELRGLGQWRNSGKGKFTWKEVK